MLHRNRGANISNPGANAVQVIYDEGNETGTASADKTLLRLTLLTDQSVVINNYWAESPTATLRLAGTSTQWTSHGAVDAPVASSHSTQPITCVAKANLVDNDYFGVTYTTVIDGVTTTLTKTFEFQDVANSYATGSVVVVDYSKIANNDTLTLNDGVNAAKVFEFKIANDAAAAGSITVAAYGSILDNDTLVLNDGVHAAKTFEFQRTTNAYASGSITVANYTLLQDNDNFTLTDGVNTATVFEFKVTGGYVRSGTRVTIDISALSSNATVAAAIHDAINGVATTLAITAGTVASAVVPLTNDAYGAYNTTIADSTHSGLTHTGMAGGAVFTPHGGGYVVIDARSAATNAAMATAIYAAISGQHGAGSFAITATDPAGTAIVALVNDVVAAYNNTITGSTHSGCTLAGMSGGSLYVLASGAVTVNTVGLTTNAQVASAIYTAVNGVGASLAITATDPAGTATVAVTNDAYGAYDATITTTAQSGSFTLSGMTGGHLYTPTVGRTEIDVSGATDAPSVAVIAAARIVTAFAGAVIAATPTTATLTLEPAACGARFTLSATEHVADAGFTIGTATNGTESVYDKTIRLRPGRNKITVVTTTAPIDWACAIETVDGEVKDY